MDQSLFTGYVSNLERRKFIYCSDDGETWYLYCYEVQGNELSMWEVEFLAKGAEGIKSTKAFRDEVTTSLKNPSKCLSTQLSFQ